MDGAARIPILVATCIGSQWRTSVLDAEARSVIQRVARLTDLEPETLADPGAGAEISQPLTSLSDIRVLITGWGAPALDAHVLDRLPSLELVVHAAGTVRGIVTDELWARGIRVSTAASANAISVADFTIAQIHLSLKNAWRLAAETAATAQTAKRAAVRGLDGATIGLIGLGRIGRLVAQRLQNLDVEVIAYDPFVTPEECARLGAASHDLATVFARADVLSIHAPLTEQTSQMVTRELLLSLPSHATIINTARGGLVNHDMLAEVLTTRTDLFALLDVTDPEPLPERHPLLTLENTFMTPHIAGSLGTEEARLGAVAAREVVRFAREAPLAHELEEGRLVLSA